MPLRILLLIPVLLATAGSVANAQIYRYVDENGQVVYTGEKPAEIENTEKVIIRHNSVSAPAITDEFGTKDVVIYTATWCGVCKSAKSFFEKQGVDYNEYDIEKSAQGKRDYKRMRGRGVPIILVGDQRMNGFDPERFKRLYSAEN